VISAYQENKAGFVLFRVKIVFTRVILLKKEGVSRGRSILYENLVGSVLGAAIIKT